MTHTDAPKAGVGRRGFFTGLASGLSVAAVALGARKVRAGSGKSVRKPERGPILYRRTEEMDRYLKTMD
ncbi:MAG TPA: hypothetical protein VKB51_13955 [bacterium]|nr:hypothetical protein [bacterium]